jgi:hypothetical protein
MSISEQFYAASSTSLHKSLRKALRREKSLHNNQCNNKKKACKRICNREKTSSTLIESSNETIIEKRQINEGKIGAKMGEQESASVADKIASGGSAFMVHFASTPKKHDPKTSTPKKDN